MAGGKKKKKVVANPARGFATTSIASKAKIEVAEAEADDQPASAPAQVSSAAPGGAPPEEGKVLVAGTADQQSAIAADFEHDLEESHLQILVDNHAVKAKREAARQAARLETDRRVLRGQAESLNTRTWLPVEIMDDLTQLLLIDDYGRSTLTPAITSSKAVTEDDLMIRLWTLQRALLGAGFLVESIQSALEHVLGIALQISNATREAIWGLEECLEWLARNCSKDQLPDYDGLRRPVARSGRATPLSLTETSEKATLDLEGLFVEKKIAPFPKAARKDIQHDSDSDIDPEDMIEAYLDCKKQLLWRELQSNFDRGRREDQTAAPQTGGSRAPVEKLQRKLDRLEADVLFDKYVAYQAWELQRPAVHKQYLEELKREHKARDLGAADQTTTGTSVDLEDDVSRQAARLGEALLDEANSDSGDGILSNMFDSLPVAETDPTSGKTSIVLKEQNGAAIQIRDFGKWTGVNPTRILEEACKARDNAVKLIYSGISTITNSNRHALKVTWNKAQEPPANGLFCGVENSCSPKQFIFAMTEISSPDAKQSEAYIATIALFLIFGGSAKEAKAALRQPSNWRDLWMEMVRLRKTETDDADRNALRGLRDMLRAKEDQELEEGVLNTDAFRNRATTREVGQERSVTTDAGVGKMLASVDYQRIWMEKCATNSYRTMLESRMKLPMWSFKGQVLQALDASQCIIICGETGCGKSTQTPAYILEHALSQGQHCKIYCTEPRRISALSLARRVSEELGERRNDLGTPRSLVGYAIRLETNVARETRLVYATTGIVLRMLEGSQDLADITHIIIDEVHERTIDSDFLLIVLKKVMARRHDLKVVLMSATVDGERFSKYLDGAPVLNVPGRTYPVQLKYLEDAIELTGYSPVNGRSDRLQDMDDDLDASDNVNQTSGDADQIKTLHGYSARTKKTIAQFDEYRIDFDLILHLLCKIASASEFTMFSKAILIFLPGIAEIRQLNDLIGSHPMFSTEWLIYPLHSTIATEDQEAAFQIPPRGMRKIILASNIAETGITIPDITCVVDAGKHREMRFDERRQLSRLLETFISRANAKQRRGRAGRVQEGLCFHLFTKHRHDTLMANSQTPEFLRLSLQDLAIRVKICNLGGIEETLSEALDPPSTKNIRRAIDALIDVRALTQNETLTPLGTQLAKLPLDVFLGKLLILGCIFKCLDSVVTIAAILSSKSPFMAPFGARAQADTVRLGFRRGDSDLLTIYNAYQAWRRVCITGGSEFQFCKKNFLSTQTLSNIEDLKGQLIVSMVDSGFLPLTDVERSSLSKARFSNQRRRQYFFDIPHRANINNDNDLVITSVICWAFYPKLLVRDGKGYRSLANNQSISPHPTSVNKGHLEFKYLSFYHIMQAKQFYNAHETTAVEDFAIMLLCGDVKCDMYAGVFILDGNRARFSVGDWKVMLALKTLRERLRDILTRMYRFPGKPLSSQQQRWMELWQKIFTVQAEARERRLGGSGSGTGGAG